MNETIAVIGAGSWGTTLANLLAKKGYPVTIWAHEPDVARAIEEEHANSTYLAGVKLDERLRATSDRRGSRHRRSRRWPR